MMRDLIDALGITDRQSAAEWRTSSTLTVDAIGAINAMFCRGRFVVPGAVRQDDCFFQTVQQLDKGDYPLNGDGLTRIMRPGPPADFADRTCRPRDARRNPVGPPLEASIRPRIAAPTATVIRSMRTTALMVTTTRVLSKAARSRGRWARSSTSRAGSIRR